MEDKILNLLNQTFPDKVWCNESDLLLNGNIDSFDMVILVTEIESVLDVEIPGDKISYENFENFRTIHALLLELS